MSEPIVIAAIGEFSDGASVRRIGVSDQAYHDPALAGSLEFGTFIPCIGAETALSFSELVEFQTQGGSATTQVSDLPLIYDKRIFEGWPGYVVAGMKWTLKRGRPDWSWDEFELIFEAEAHKIPEITGDQELTIRLRDPFGRLSQPASKRVFGEDVPNERYVNRLMHKVFGDVTQVVALVIDPNFNRVHAAENVGVIRKVAEGGNPTTNWTDVEMGYQGEQGLFEGGLPITADFSGPRRPESEQRDLFAEIGGFDTWTNGDPDGMTITETPPDSEISEDAVNGGANILSALGASVTGESFNAGSAASGLPGIGRSLTGLDAGNNPVDVSEWPALVASNDGARIVATIGGASLSSPRLTLTDFGAAFGSSADITGLTVGIRAQKTGAGSGAIRFSEVRLLLPNGSVTANRANTTPVTGTKDLHEFGGATDTWDLTLTPELINEQGLGLRIAFDTASSGSFPVSAEIFEVILTAHTGSGSKTAQIHVDFGLTPGDRLRWTVFYDDLGAGDSISMKCAGVETITSPVPDLVRTPGSTGAIQAQSENLDDPNISSTAVLEGAGEASGEIIADGPVFAFEFFKRPGQTGAMRIVRLQLDELSITENRIKGLTRYVFSEAGYDPDTQLNNTALDSIAAATGDPKLGWLVRDESTFEQVLTMNFHSLGSTGWGSIDGQYQACMQVLPHEPNGEYLIVEPSRKTAPSTMVLDEAEDLRDRVFAARNVDPLRPSETAGVTTTWPESERQKVLADWRITALANFDTILAGDVWPFNETPP